MSLVFGQSGSQRIALDGLRGLYVVLTDVGGHVEVEWTARRSTLIRYPGLTMEDTEAFCRHAAEDPSVLDGAADYRFIEDPR